MEAVPDKKFAHHMIREIHEQPQAVKATLAKSAKQVESLAETICKEKYEMIYVTGSGTSYNAGLAGTYAFSVLTKLVTSLIPASEFKMWLPTTFPRKSLLLAISQSGESSDVLNAVKVALERKMTVVALTNTPQSSLAKMANYTLLTHATEELAVTATKSYTSQLSILFSLTLEISRLQGENSERLEMLKEILAATPNFVDKTIAFTEEEIHELANTFQRVNYFFLLGSGPNYATALEGALKLKEACNLFAEGFASREFLHGPIQLIDGRTPIILLLTEDEIESFMSLMRGVVSFGAPLISISEKADVLTGVSTNVIRLPESYPKVFSPILYVIPLQLFAYYSSIARNLNPDKPEKLRKVVKE